MWDGVGCWDGLVVSVSLTHIGQHMSHQFNMRIMKTW